MKDNLRLGVDLGGTKIEAVILDAQDRVLWRERVAMPVLDRQGNLDAAYQQTLGKIAGLLTAAVQAEPAARTLPLGMGTPGAECASGSRQGRMKNCNSVWLNDRALRQDLENYLQRPVRLANDANCFALAEAQMGAARGATTVFGVILGTGVGGGLVVRGQLLEGANHIAGEWGHNRLPVPWAQSERGANEIDEVIQLRPCYCGRINCLETYLSGPGLANSYRLSGGDAIKAEEVIARKRSGEPLANSIWKQYAQQLARSLAQVINIVDPDVIVIGGGVSNITEIFMLVPTLWTPYIFSDVINTRLVQAQLGDSAGVFGAAWLWDSDHSSGSW